MLREHLTNWLKLSDEEVLRTLPDLTNSFLEVEWFDFLLFMEETSNFGNRLPLRLQIYASLAEGRFPNEIRLVSLIRLLRRLGSRTDLPDLGAIPNNISEFTDFVARTAPAISNDDSLVAALTNLAYATRAFRRGNIPEMKAFTVSGIDALSKNDSWVKPPVEPQIIDLAIAETGHELFFIATNALYRSGDVEGARSLTELWLEQIQIWEKSLGMMSRVRYQYFQLLGNIFDEIGLPEQSLESYVKALDYAPTRYRKAFLWINMAQIERKLGLMSQSWNHSVDAIQAWLESPYPQTAAPWIEWLAKDADSPEKSSLLDTFRKILAESGGKEINVVTKSITRLYRLERELKEGIPAAEILPKLEEIISSLEEAESWPNVITVLAIEAVLAGRIDDRKSLDEAVIRAREIIDTKLTGDAKPPSIFLLESANALALRNVGAYNEAFKALFERALEARIKYPGSMGPDERSAIEALYYLGALAGYDMDSIEKRVRKLLTGIQ